MLNNIVTLNLA